MREGKEGMRRLEGQEKVKKNENMMMNKKRKKKGTCVLRNWGDFGFG